MVVLITGCARKEALREEADAFLEAYTKTYKALSYTAERAQWRSNTMIVEGDTTNAFTTRKAREALAAFTGSRENIERASAH
jgi:peptidyl-dipeptidase A